MKEIQLNPQQLEAVSHRDGPMIVLSVVGSGKTMVLTERIIHLIEEYGINPANLLAITFAKKAVLEIQSRLEKRLNGTVIGARAEIALNIFGFLISLSYATIIKTECPPASPESRKAGRWRAGPWCSAPCDGVRNRKKKDIH